jgi:hypothetical protein
MFVIHLHKCKAFGMRLLFYTRRLDAVDFITMDYGELRRLQVLETIVDTDKIAQSQRPPQINTTHNPTRALRDSPGATNTRRQWVEMIPACEIISSSVGIGLFQFSVCGRVFVCGASIFVMIGPWLWA